jgi:membrane protein
MNGHLSDVIPGWQYVNIFLSYVLITILFATIYKFLPDVKVEWKYIWLGAIITSVLFSLGKFLIGIYMSKSSYQSIFGAAGSLVVFMAWIYYSSFIFFFSAEFMQVYRKKYAKSPLIVNRYAIKVEKVTNLINDAVEQSANLQEKAPK